MAAFNTVFGNTIPDLKHNVDNAQLMFEDFAFANNERNRLYTLREPPAYTQNLGSNISKGEIPFAIDIGIDVPICGRIDGWANLKHGGVFALEYKTTSQMSDMFWGAFEMHIQTIGYALALQTMTAEPIAGTIVVGLLKSKSKQSTELRPFHVHSHTIEEFKRWLCHIGRMILACEQNDYWPMQVTGCNSLSSYGMPSFTCSFTSTCQSPNWLNDVQRFPKQKEHIPFPLTQLEGVK